MKTTFKVKRGHVWHVVHETKTQYARNSAWTLCGQYYAEGERGARTPTCPGCLKFDNPLTLSREEREILRDAARISKWKDPPRRTHAFEQLVKRDYITAEAALTRRGAILVEDFDLVPVPLSATDGLVHARGPLLGYPRCHRARQEPTPPPNLIDATAMTTERYSKLRKVCDQVIVTCFQCLALREPSDDLY